MQRGLIAMNYGTVLEEFEYVDQIKGRGRQNERDLVMVKDPLIDFEEMVVGIRSLGSIPRPVGSSRGGSSSLWSLSKLRARWGQFRSNQLRSSGVCPVGPLRPQRAHWCRSLRGTNGACGDPTGG